MKTDVPRKRQNKKGASPHPIRKERGALQADLQLLKEQVESLGILDPLELEPAIIYFPVEEKK